MNPLGGKIKKQNAEQKGKNLSSEKKLNFVHRQWTTLN